MSMPIVFASKVSLFSMRRRFIRTTLSLLPCVLLIAVMYVGSTIPHGLVNELDKKVLQTVESRQEVVMLDSFLFTQFGGFSGGPNGQSESNTSFNQEAYDKATKSPQVAEVYPQYGQVSGTVAQLGNVPNATLNYKGSSAEFARLYTDKSFAYEAGKPIPVLLNPSSIGSQTYNWAGASTLEIDYSKPEELEKNMPYHQLKDTEALVGTTFKAVFTNFPQYPEAFEESKQSGFSAPKSKLTKLTDADRTILDRRVSEIYSPYWNIEALKKPVEFEFVVVGLILGQNISDSGIVPNEAVVSIWNEVYQAQASARTTKAFEKDFISGEQVRTRIHEGFLEMGYLGYPQLAWQKDPSVSAWQVQLSSVGVPGLLYQTSLNAKGESVYTEAPKMTITSANFRADSAVVRLHSADDREAYMTYLKDNNIQIFDASPLALIKSIRKGSTIFVTWLTIILGVIVAFILLTTVSRFVADSRREIGVWRAIGATRLDIMKLVLTRMIWLLIFGISIGILIGFGVSVVLSGMIAASVNEAGGGFNPYGGGGQSFVGQIIISLLGGIVPTLDRSALVSTDWGLLGSRLGILASITLVVGLIPALRAARISPVTAIRDSE